MEAPISTNDLQPVLAGTAATIASLSHALGLVELTNQEVPADDGEVPEDHAELQDEADRLTKLINDTQEPLLSRLDALLRLPSVRLMHAIAVAENEFRGVRAAVEEAKDATRDAIEAVDVQIERIESYLEDTKMASDQIKEIIMSRIEDLRGGTKSAGESLDTVRADLVNAISSELKCLEALLNSAGTRADSELGSLERKSHEVFSGTVRQIQDAGGHISEVVDSTLGRAKEIATKVEPVVAVMRSARAII